MKTNKALVFWLALLLMFAGVMTIWLGWKRWVGTGIAATGTAAVIESSRPDVPTQPLLTEFELTDQLGQPFHSKDLDGKLWIGSFFFASCPQICRMQNMQVAKLQQKYCQRGVELVSITCDPLRDTPAALATYSQLFNADPEKWHFLTGDLLYIRRVGAEYFQVAVEEETHSDRLMVIDRTGKIRGSFRSTKPEQFAALESLLDELLAESDAGTVVDQANDKAVSSGAVATDAVDTTAAGEEVSAPQESPGESPVDQDVQQPAPSDDPS